MPIFYRGAGISTYWHTNDARVSGSTPQSPGTLPSSNRLMYHLTIELETLVRTLRDAEILAVGNIPSACVRTRFPEWP